MMTKTKAKALRSTDQTYGGAHTGKARTIFAEDLPELLVVHVLSEVLDVHVGELFGPGAKLSLAFFAGLETPYKPAIGVRHGKIRTAAQSPACNWTETCNGKMMKSLKSHNIRLNEKGES